MASFKITGGIEKIFDTQQINDTFKKREFVIKVQDGEYVDYIKIEALQKNCELLDQYGEGQEVTVHFNLNGKPYEKNGKTMYFNNLRLWKFDDELPAVQAPQAPSATQETTEGENEMPF
jgi:hypothetical protein